ncbi:MAG TPA: hypothetical protein VGL13_11175, partial [Polyangiaceae bacterium]
SYATPASPVDRYPTFYVYKLLTEYARGGETVVAASSDYDGLGVYAVTEQNGKRLNLLLINKRPTATLGASIAIHGFHPDDRADVYSYGIAQDDAARTGIGSPDIAHTKVKVSGSTFTYAAAPYSAVVLRMSASH